MADQVLESAMLLGSGAAVMNQLAMLGVGLGVAEHSTTLQRQADRLRTTLTYVYGMATGTAGLMTPPWGGRSGCAGA